MIIGVDYHPSDEYVAFADTETAECVGRRLDRSYGRAEKFDWVSVGSFVCHALERCRREPNFLTGCIAERPTTSESTAGGTGVVTGKSEENTRSSQAVPLVSFL